MSAAQRLIALFDAAVVAIASVALWDKEEPEASGVLINWANTHRYPLQYRVLDEWQAVYAVELPHKRTIDVYVRREVTV